MQSLRIPGSLLKIASNAFECCNNLKSVVIDSGVEYISNLAFDGCSSLESVSIPDTVDHISGSAFRGCTSLRTIEVEEGTIVKNGAFHEVTEIQRRKGDPTIKEAKLKKHAILKKQAFEKRAARNRFKQKEKSRKRWGILFCLLILSLVVCWYIFYVMH